MPGAELCTWSSTMLYETATEVVAVNLVHIQVAITSSRVNRGKNIMNSSVSFPLEDGSRFFNQESHNYDKYMAS